MLGIDLYKEALINGENSKYFGKKYKVKGESDSIFTIRYNDIVRDDLTSLFSLDLWWVRKEFFTNELEEVKQEIEMKWYECIEKYAEEVNKYYIKVEDVAADNNTYTYCCNKLVDDKDNALSLYEIKYCNWYLCER